MRKHTVQSVVKVPDMKNMKHFEHKLRKLITKIITEQYAIKNAKMNR